MKNHDIKRGRFIVFEGIDGAGKTTQINLLRDYLESIGRSVKITAEPTGYESGKRLREALSGAVVKSALEMAEMFVLDRINHNQNESDGIKVTLKKGIDVVCDRYYYSTLAYQGSEADYDYIKSLNLDNREITKPDLCIFLDLTPEVSLARINQRNEAKEIYETKEKLTSVREAFKKIFGEIDDKVAIIDASGSIEEVAEKIRSAVMEVL